MKSILRCLNAQKTALLLFLCTVIGLLFALFMQYVMGATPCPLCITQRIELILVGIFALLAFLLSRFTWALRLGLMLSGIFSLLGIGTAAWQIYIQTNRPDSIECGPGIDYLMANFPLTEALPMIFSPNSECAIPNYVIEGVLTIPQTSLMGFIVLLIIAVYGMIRTSTKG